jgi:hypothetical protein
MQGDGFNAFTRRRRLVAFAPFGRIEARMGLSRSHHDILTSR